MAVRREMESLHQPVDVMAGNKITYAAYVATGTLALLAGYILLSYVFAWGKVKLDDIRYGRPRTFHLVAPVGFEGQRMELTHFIAMNLDRQVVVMEIPGNAADQVHTLTGPYLFGDGEDLTPVTMRMEDVNGDGAEDLVLKVKNEEVIYLYRGDSFGLLTADERMHLMGRMRSQTGMLKALSSR